MSETIRLDYDPQRASAGLQKLQKELDKTAQSGSKAASGFEKFAKTSSTIPNSVNAAGDSAKKAQDAFGGLGDTLEGLGIQGIGGALGQTEKMIRGLADLGGVTGTVGQKLLTIIPHITLMVGAISAAKIAWDSFSAAQQKSIEQSDPTTQYFSEVAKGILNAFNLVPKLDDALAAYAATVQESDEYSRRFSETMYAQSRAMAQVQLAVQELSKSLENSRSKMVFKDSVDAMTDLIQLEQLINKEIEEANAKRLDHKTTLKDIQEAQERINALEQRRVQLEEELRTAAINRLTQVQNAEDKKLQTMLDTEEKVEERRRANHAAELTRIEKERQARLKSAEDREKAEADAADKAKAAIDEQIAKLEGEEQQVQQVGNAFQQVAQAAQGGPQQGASPYGEGVAVGANGPGPFARAAAREAQGGFFALPFQQAAVNETAFAGIAALDPSMQQQAAAQPERSPAQRLDDFARNAREHAMNNRAARRGILDKAQAGGALEGFDRKALAQQLESGDIESDELRKAINEATNKDIELQGKKAGIDQETIRLLQRKAEILEEHDSQLANMQNQIDQLNKLNDAVYKGAQRRRAQRAARGN